MILLTMVVIAVHADQPATQNPSADACEKAETTYQLRSCAATQFADAEKLLEREWRATAKRLKEADSSLVKEGEKPTAFATALAGQRAWITYRQKQCQAEYNEYLGGTIAPLIELNCLDRMTRARIAELRQMSEP